MPYIQALNFGTVVSGLEKSAEQLKSQNKEEAQKTILGISNEIQSLAEVSKQKETEYKQAQQEISKKVSEIIQRETELRDSSLNIKRSIDELNVEMNKDEVDRSILLNQISSLQAQLQNTQNQLREHQAKLDELNDTSAASIVISIFSLGIDRAVKGIASLINDDTGHIKSLNDELSRYQNEIHQDDENIKNIGNKLSLLNEKKRSSEAIVDELSQREIVLQEHEKSCRQRLAYFTDVTLFYGKLLIMSQQVEHKIDDVVDIVEELNDSTPTIIDFDSSGKDLISLRQALEKFDQLVSDEPALKNA
jgi:chromosome segregation ATPase